MKFTKQAACFFTALLLAVPSISAAAAEETGKSSDGKFSYTLLQDGTIAVRCENKDLEKAEVPSMIDGHKVSALDEGCFAESVYLQEVTLPEGLTTIGNGAFSSCEKLADFTLPDSVTSIGSNAFHGCSALTEFTISANVTEIGAYAFDTTENITVFEVDAANPNFSAQDGVLFDKSAETLLKYPEARPDTSYTVPASCNAIADWAFIGTQYLEQIDLGQVQHIGEDAFYYCVKLRSITIPEGVTDLIGGTFCYCVELQNVTLPSTLKTIGENCFYSCTALTDITLPKGLEKINAHAFFHCTSLQSLRVPASVQTVVSNCMGYCYDEDTQKTILQDGFKLYVVRDSAAYKYAFSNSIDYETVVPNLVYYVLIGAAAAVIAGLLIAIIKVLKKRGK